jgi:hypothetical protein
MMKAIYVRTAVGVGALVALLAAGCTGSSPELSRAAFISAVNAECIRYKAEVAALTAKYEATFEADMKKVQRETASAGASFGKKLQALEGPEELEEAVDTLFEGQERVIKDVMSGTSTDPRSTAERLSEVSDAFVAVGFDSCK